MRFYLLYDIILYQFKVIFLFLKYLLPFNVKVVSHSIERNELDF